MLEIIKDPSDVKTLSRDELQQLVDETRQFLIEQIMAVGGHFGSNLGVVELTVALHYVFDSPRDRILWDVGHQAYAHKALTGRQAQFPTLRQYGGMAGFPKRNESPHDFFGVGHASTSISAALGMAVARDLRGENHHVVAVIGDGAMTGGMAFEALNHAGDLKKRLIVILNDNEMSIAPNVGAVSQYLTKLRTDPHYGRMKSEIETLLKKIPAIGHKLAGAAERAKDSLKYFMVQGALFEEFGFKYFGPINGHDLSSVLSILEQAKELTSPVLIHVVTQKGKGYPSAETAPDKLHSVGGAVTKPKKATPSYTQVFADALTELARTDERIVAITAAMPSGTGLNRFAAEFPERCFDVGIAEQHAATFCAGLSTAGMRPVFAVYSTFLQRAYDQVIHDICIQNLPVVFAIDRAGLVGPDGETHQGVFDVAFLRTVPNMTIMMPKDEGELRHMLFTSLTLQGPVAVRYPREDGRGVALDQSFMRLPIGVSEIVREGSDVALLALGPMVAVAENAALMLNQRGISALVINLRFVKPLDEAMLLRLAHSDMPIVTLEEASAAGGVGGAILEFYATHDLSVRVHPIGIADHFVEHGSREELLHHVGLTADHVAREAETLLHRPQSEAQTRVEKRNISPRLVKK
ncbi:1-deoxy-D-xylulose-5-phosphate synthase [Ferroacidibacillus organovorans]|uniref:1-deoxy-D-xylulose-5-phosphate synthase n=1 Tax=Ferroacidibacillus organovorans TaxID=1765683 RepID=A0A1V4EU60_9BACL|nr:1-deoxy-D-xylulose-5-phosphate synthase [Ferroacidibacillus organovorans]OPG16473.1 1-deoxy-D-xylulose-5-phosphate synthase [Ferroacidibacillus organovorans]